jgi:hypothetical protein
VLPHGVLPTGDAVRRRVGRRGGFVHRGLLRLCLESVGVERRGVLGGAIWCEFREPTSYVGAPESL